jgi:hypothetical protein
MHVFSLLQNFFLHFLHEITVATNRKLTNGLDKNIFLQNLEPNSKDFFVDSNKKKIGRIRNTVATGIGIFWFCFNF